MAEDQIADRFGEEPAKLEKAVLATGGGRSILAEFAFEIPALPRVPVTVVLWPACEGIGATARILFKPGAPYYFHSEDLAALGVVTAERLTSLYNTRGPGGSDA
jgi:hypothetical protein